MPNDPEYIAELRKFLAAKMEREQMAFVGIKPVPFPRVPIKPVAIIEDDFDIPDVEDGPVMFEDLNLEDSPLFKAVIRNLPKNYVIQVRKGLSEVDGEIVDWGADNLNMAMCWADTPQGVDYWSELNQVCERYNNR